jgi:hypothetical protein
MILLERDRRQCGRDAGTLRNVGVGALTTPVSQVRRSSAPAPRNHAENGGSMNMLARNAGGLWIAVGTGLGIAAGAALGVASVGLAIGLTLGIAAGCLARR